VIVSKTPFVASWKARQEPWGMGCLTFPFCRHECQYSGL